MGAGSSIIAFPQSHLAEAAFRPLPSEWTFSIPLHGEGFGFGELFWKKVVSAYGRDFSNANGTPVFKSVAMLKDISVREEKGPHGRGLFFGGDKFGLQTEPFRFLIKLQRNSF